jgi:hypothetical protein
MTLGKASALAAGFVGALAIGVAIGPTVHDKWSNANISEHRAIASQQTPQTPASERVSAPKTTKANKAAAPARSESIRKAPAPPAGAVTQVAVDMWEPELRDRARSVLNRGAKLELAAADFGTAEDFLTVAHAAHNTSVPFMVLKHRVLNEGQTLAEAIREHNPALDAKAEAERARTAARSDMADLS